MIVQMHKNKGVSQDTPFLCNQYENQVSEITILIPPEYVNETYFYYMICKSPNTQTPQFAVPLILSENKVTYLVGSNISWTSGNWEFCLLIKSVEIVNGEVGTDGIVAVSDYFTGKVKSGIIDESQLAEQPVDPNIIIIYDSVLAVLASENARTIAENLRTAAENAREADEVIRETNEDNRVFAENIRVTNENDRLINETARQEAESARVLNEIDRAQKENGRVSAENLRDNAEQSRVVAENNRANAETERNNQYNTAEGERDTAYETAEGVRNQQAVTAEQNRNTEYTQAESNRDTLYNQAEDNRDTLYQQAEQNRDARVATVEEQINTLASKTVVTLNHQFADVTARDTYFTANPTELVDKLFIKVGTGYQQYIESVWQDASAVVTEQLTANLQALADAGNHFTNKTTEGALQEVGSVLDTLKTDLTDVKKYTNTPIATYTHTSNKQVAVTAVDLATGTFTSVGHGLANGNLIAPIINLGLKVYPHSVYPTGLNMASYPGYYVVNATADTFQISATSGGASKTYTANATIDLTKWHFEKIPDNLTISNLGILQKCKIKLNGRFLVSATNYIFPGSITIDDSYVGLTTTFDYPYVFNTGCDVSVLCDIEWDLTKYAKVSIKASGAKSNTSSTFTNQKRDELFVSTIINNLTFNSVKTSNMFFANGSVIEVYKI